MLRRTALKVMTPKRWHPRTDDSQNPHDRSPEPEKGRSRANYPETLDKGFWQKTDRDQRRRGGAGVNRNSGRSSKSFLLRPDPTGGSARTHSPNSPKDSPDALPCPADAGGGRSHDVEALRNMMTEAAVRSSGASGARVPGGALRREEHPSERWPDEGGWPCSEDRSIHQDVHEPENPQKEHQKRRRGWVTIPTADRRKLSAHPTQPRRSERVTSGRWA
jgi:hypothetical protein